MKNITTTLLLLGMLSICATTVLAQKKKDKDKDKNEAKEWKKRVKNMSPLQYRNLQEELTTLRAEANAQRTKDKRFDEERNDLKKQLAGIDANLAQVQTQITQAQEGINAQNQAAKEAEAAYEAAKAQDPAYGVSFKVQLGAFRERDLSPYITKGNFYAEEDPQGVKKYTAGVFKDYCTAKFFQAYLKQMGAKDAWIVAYKDNVRCEISEVVKPAEVIKCK